MAGGRGRLVVLEGGEGVGKTTQVARLVAALDRHGIAVESYREPGGTSISEPIRRLLLDPEYHDITARTEALLFMAARAQLIARVRSRLDGGTTVVLDRFFLSTFAYQVAGRGLPEELVRAANALAVDGVVPDVTLLLVCDPGVAMARAQSRGALDRLEQAGDEFHRRVAAGYSRASSAEWQRAHPEVGPVVQLDAAGSPDEVERRIAGALAARWPETFAALGESQ